MQGHGGGYWDPEEIEKWERKLEETAIYHKNARFFIMKSKDYDSVQKSHQTGVWSTTFGPTSET